VLDALSHNPSRPTIITGNHSGYKLSPGSLFLPSAVGSPGAQEQHGVSDGLRVLASHADALKPRHA